jgi:HEAT repeat protein
MRDAGEDVLRLALLALGESRDERALPALCEYAETPGSKEVRSTALLALSIARLPLANEYLLSLVERLADRGALEVISALESQRLDSALMERLGTIATTRGDPVQSAFREMTRRGE